MGVQIEAENVKVAMLDHRGHYLHFVEEPVERHTPDDMAAMVARKVWHLVEFRRAGIDDVTGVGITLDGDIDFYGGLVREFAPFDWQGVELAGMVADRLKKQVFIDTYLNGAALAEMWLGAGWGQRNMLLVDFRSDQLNFRYIENGRLVRGKSGCRPVTAEHVDLNNRVEWLLPMLENLAPEIEPGLIVLQGLAKLEDKSFWSQLKQAWQPNSGSGRPELLPAELGAEGPLFGGAALVKTEL